MDVLVFVGILALSLAVGLLAAWTVLRLVMVVMMRPRTVADFGPHPALLSDKILPELAPLSAR